MNLNLLALLLVSVLGIIFGRIRKNKLISIISLVVFLLLIIYILFSFFVTFDI